MEQGFNVFISWSGRRSKAAAEALRKWLPLVVQSAKPWMSDADIEKGSRGLEEIGKALEGIKVGVICLTPKNLAEPWILYEAGALSKTLDAKTRVCTYLLGGLRKRDVSPPLGLFQATEADSNDTRKFVHAVNNALERSVPEENLDHLFRAMWPELEEKLAALPAAREAAAPEAIIGGYDSRSVGVESLRRISPWRTARRSRSVSRDHGPHGGHIDVAEDRSGNYSGVKQSDYGFANGLCDCGFANGISRCQ